MKEWTSDFHPFNSNKHFSQIYRWKEIGKYPSPAPASVSLDPSNICQLDCLWCNSKYIRGKSNKIIGKEELLEIADLLPRFSDHKQWGKVEAVCIAGGGEPLTNPNLQYFIDRVKFYGIKPGLITNGVLLDKFDVSNCSWVGVSVDAGSREVYKETKMGDYFDKVIKNIETVVNAQGEISKPGRAHGVSFKYVMHPNNVQDVYKAAVLAKDLGCKNFHLRPYGVPFKSKGIPFSNSDIKSFREQLTKARDLEDKDFKVYGITHKFNGESLFNANNAFDKCFAVAFSATFEPPTNKGFNVSLCCDRRGDPELTLEDITAEDFRKYWGSKEHMALIDKINPKKCPRCTRGPHNQVYEKSILEDNIDYEFG